MPKQLYSQRFGTVELVFANIQHNKRLTRLNHRGRAKVNTQRHLYCMVHNIEKLSKTGLGQPKGQQVGDAGLQSPSGANEAPIAAHCGHETETPDRQSERRTTRCGCCRETGFFTASLG